MANWRNSCRVDGCVNKPVKGRAWCTRHLGQMKRDICLDSDAFISLGGYQGGVVDYDSWRFMTIPSVMKKT